MPWTVVVVVVAGAVAVWEVWAWGEEEKKGWMGSRARMRCSTVTRWRAVSTVAAAAVAVGVDGGFGLDGEPLGTGADVWLAGMDRASILNICLATCQELDGV